MNEYTGISFPFRIGNKGGVVMSTTTVTEATHLEESIRQILSTRPFERAMEAHLGCSLSVYVFDPNDTTACSLIAYEAQRAIEEQEPRVEVVSCTAKSGAENAIMLEVVFKVRKFDATYSTNVKVGET